MSVTASDDLTRATAISERRMSQTYRDLVAFASLRCDAISGADLERNVAWLIPACEAAGLRTQRIENGERPMVFAEWPQRRPDVKTVLCYLHFDGQPANAKGWDQPDPWQPTLKRRDGERWETLALDALYGEHVDPQWRLFGRAIADDKGPVIMLLAALNALREAGAAPAMNIKLIFDSEEEKGSPSIGEVVERNHALLAADDLLIIDGPMHASGRPTIVYGNRGVQTATLTVYGPQRAAHSGHFGNVLPNPAFALASLLHSMKDDGGRVTIPGYYDGVELDPKTHAILAAVPDDRDGALRDLGVARAETVGATIQEALQYPSLNVRGLHAGAVGNEAATIIPDRAVAEIDVRTVPETDPARLFGLIVDHIRGQGYLVIDRAPSDAERRTHRRIASWVEERRMGRFASRTELGAPIGGWVEAALRAASQHEPVRIRMMGGTVPTEALVRGLAIPFVILPLANHDDNQHVPNENLRLANVINGIRTLLTLLTSA